MNDSETNERSRKTPRVVHYDVKEVHKFMRKQRQQLKQKDHEESGTVSAETCMSFVSG